MDVSVERLSHTYPGKPPRQALADVSFHIPSGQFCALLGPSGCGKTTLLRLAAGLLQPTSGQVWLDGQTAAQAAARRCIAWMAQSPALLPWLNARDNVALVRRFAAPQAGERLEPREALARVGLSDAEHTYPFQLSGGMQQRLALARLLCQGASVWLMDEPFAALDALTRERLAAELLTLWQPLRRPEGQPLPAPPSGRCRRPEGQPLPAPPSGRCRRPEGQPLRRPEGDPRLPPLGAPQQPPQPLSERVTVLWVTHHIHEALRLADRALVLSPRPGRVILDLPVDLPRPRREDSPAFQACLVELKAALGLAAPAEAG